MNQATENLGKTVLLRKKEILRKKRRYGVRRKNQKSKASKGGGFYKRVGGEGSARTARTSRS